VAALSIREQDDLIRASWPNIRTVIAGKRLGIWRGAVQGLSRAYDIEIVYVRNRRDDPFRYRYAPFPQVTVLDPPLTRRIEDPDDPIPHVYPARDRPVLCLFDPRDDGWTRDQSIANTILAWTASWLRFYEAWHATGVWTGGGALHGPRVQPAAALEEETTPAGAPSPDSAWRRRDLLNSSAADALLTGLFDHRGLQHGPGSGDPTVRSNLLEQAA